MKTCKEIAKEWKMSERSIANLCKQGRIAGAAKVGKSWQIPDDVVRPVDLRRRETTVENNGKSYRKKPLPIGISDYVRAQAEYYYVDKTMLIKEFIDRKPLVSLFTRPRRFGKTLNMDMLRVFFEISEEDTSIYFRDKEIWQAGEDYTKYQGKYPVIFLTFKDVKFDSWDATMDKIRGLLQDEFGRHSQLLTSEKLEEYERDYFRAVLQGTAGSVELTAALENLSRMLHKHYGIAPIIIIDEYDIPIQEGYAKDFYEDIVGFMRNFFSGAFRPAGVETARDGPQLLGPVLRAGGQVQADAHHQPFQLAALDVGPGFRQDAADLLAVIIEVIDPLDAQVQPAEPLHSPADGHRRADGDGLRLGHGQAGPQHQREINAFPRRALEPPPQPAPARRLLTCQHHRAVGLALEGQRLGRAVGAFQLVVEVDRGVVLPHRLGAEGVAARSVLFPFLRVER